MTSALLHELMIVLMRMVDDCCRGGPYGTNRATLLRVSEMLEDAELLDALVDDARQWIPSLPHMAEKNATAVRDRLTRARDGIATLRDGEGGKMWRSALKEHRNNFLAHSLVGLDQREPLRFRYIGELLNAFGPIIEDLRFCVSGDHWEVDGSQEHYRDMSENFWSLVEAGQRARRGAFKEDDAVTPLESRECYGASQSSSTSSCWNASRKGAPRPRLGEVQGEEADS